MNKDNKLITSMFPWKMTSRWGGGGGETRLEIK